MLRECVFSLPFSMRLVVLLQGLAEHLTQGLVFGFQTTTPNSFELLLPSVACPAGVATGTSISEAVKI